jgi:MerR family transcriptional regulator, mercuric resistance operon regulatory protein
VSGDSLTPAALAELTGVSTDTLRHYERKGLLARPPRTDAGHRRYPAAAADRVRLIQRALTIGFSLDELARVLRRRERGEAPCADVRALVGARRADLDRQIDELVALRRDLDALLADWDQRLAATPPGKQARLLQHIVKLEVTR